MNNFSTKSSLEYLVNLNLGGYCLETSDLNILEECYKATGHFDKIDQINSIRADENKNTKLAEIKILGNDKIGGDTIIKQGDILSSLKVSLFVFSDL